MKTTSRCLWQIEWLFYLTFSLYKLVFSFTSIVAVLVWINFIHLYLYLYISLVFPTWLLYSNINTRIPIERLVTILQSNSHSIVKHWTSSPAKISKVVLKEPKSCDHTTLSESQPALSPIIITL